MTERPILFSAPMVRALLDGSKTQTRRVMARQKKHEFTEYTLFGQQGYNNGPWKAIEHAPDWPDGRDDQCSCPYATHRGDQLWVREAWAHDAPSLEQCRAAHEDVMADGGYGPYYRATEIAPDTLRWKPSIHMPRWASRITLQITRVRVERLQDISADDAFNEGIKITLDSTTQTPLMRVSGKYPPANYIDGFGLAIAEYASLWESINGPGSWAANPWVWVIEFKVIK